MQRNVPQSFNRLLMMVRTDESAAYTDSSSLRFTARAGRGAHGAEEPVCILLADGPEGLRVTSAEELDNADPTGRSGDDKLHRRLDGRWRRFDGRLHGGGGGSTDGSMAAAAFLFRNMKRPQGKMVYF
jgi:hypothetical protein